jgi:hypothetical protein
MCLESSFPAPAASPLKASRGLVASGGCEASVARLASLSPAPCIAATTGRFSLLLPSGHLVVLVVVPIQLSLASNFGLCDEDAVHQDLVQMVPQVSRVLAPDLFIGQVPQADPGVHHSAEPEIVGEEDVF